MYANINIMCDIDKVRQDICGANLYPNIMCDIDKERQDICGNQCLL